MIQLLLYLIQLVVLALCFVMTIVFLVMGVINRKEKLKATIYYSLAMVLIVATFFLLSIDLFSKETTNRQEATFAFKENFGFKPPDAVKKINLKNYSLRDYRAHWMAFTYDSIVFNKILRHDQALDTAYAGTQSYNDIVAALQEEDKNTPEWFVFPDHNAPKIYSKKNFLPHSSSNYYLWVDTREKMVYLEVIIFD